jgi:hypothetical protein
MGNAMGSIVTKLGKFGKRNVRRSSQRLGKFKAVEFKRQKFNSNMHTTFHYLFKATLTSLAPNWPMASSNSSDKKQRRIDLSQTAGIRAGTQVAVKMLSPERASTKRHQIDFLHEIGIVQILCEIVF